MIQGKAIGYNELQVEGDEADMDDQNINDRGDNNWQEGNGEATVQYPFDFDTELF